MRLYPRHRIDLSTADHWAAVGSVFGSWSADRLRKRICSHWDETAVVALSVRSAFDAVLGALALPPGSEVVMSAITIPHMVDLVRHHGLVPVAVDVEADTAAPTAAAVEAALTDRTGAVVVAHLFGGTADLDPIAALLADRGVPLVEDAAQAFHAPGQRGHPGAAVTLFSFGSIKTATALGGAVALVADPELRDRVRRLEASWPTQPRWAYAKKVAVYLFLGAIRSPSVYGLFARLVGRGLDPIISGFSRGFLAADGAALARRVRHRPSAALLGVLARRLDRFDPARVVARARRGREVADALGDRVEVPGRRLADHTWWLVPVAVDDVVAVQARLREVGFDASSGSTSLAAIDGSPTAKELLARVVYLPAYPEVDPLDLETLVSVLRGSTREVAGALPRPRRAAAGSAR